MRKVIFTTILLLAALAPLPVFATHGTVGSCQADPTTNPSLMFDGRNNTTKPHAKKAEVPANYVTETERPTSDGTVMADLACLASATAPQSLKAEENPLPPLHIVIWWTSPPNASFTSYRIYRSTSSNSETDPPITSSIGNCAGQYSQYNPTCFIDNAKSDSNPSGIEPNKNYYYKVRASSDSGLGDFSNEAAVYCTSSLANAVTENQPHRVARKLLEVFTGCGNSSKVFLWAIGVGAILALGVITYSGVIYSLSGLSEEKSHAKEWIRGAIEGLLLLIVAYVILRVINPTLVTF